MTPVHTHTMRRGALRNRARDWAACAAGAVLGTVGVALVIGAGGTSVYVEGSQFHVGATVLHLVSESSAHTVYGGDAAFELTTTTSGRVIAVARWIEDGVLATAACEQTTVGGSTTVVCRYSGVAGGFSTSTDVFDATAGSWHRVYSDGVDVDIRVPAGAVAVPVAFPVGR